jgi:uncharacterized protein
MDELRSLIRHARLEANLTQAELAARAATSQPAITRYEQGDVVPTLLTLKRLLAACGRRVIISTTVADRTVSLTNDRREPDMQLLHDCRQRLLHAACTCGAHEVRLFGSVARGEQHSGSDVDLLIELEPGRTLLDLAAFKRKASDILGVPVDVATPDMLKEHVRAEALTHARPL